jgi:hypothetical protein
MLIITTKDKFISPIARLVELGVILGIILFITARWHPVQAAVSTDPNLKVAFIGDSESGSSFQNVLDLIKQEGAHLVMHQGDLAFGSGDAISKTWIDRINATLGSNFLYLGSDGNHDSWGRHDSTAGHSYASFFRARLSANGLDPSVISDSHSSYAVTYRGLKMVNNKEGGDASFNQSQLQNDNHIWKVCGMHQTRNDFQAGGKGDTVILQTFLNCLNYGAIIAVAHEHSYSRTCSLSNPGSFSASNNYGATCQNPSVMQVGPNRSFLFVSGMGGKSIRDYHASEHDDDAWWSTIYTSNRYCKNNCTKVNCTSGTCQDRNNDISSYDYTHGALFITFYADGNPNKARGYFKNVKNQTIDQFEVYASGTPGPTATPTPPTTLSAKAILAGYGTNAPSLDILSDNLVNLLDLLTFF